jgi:hypothetical protein
MTVLDRMDQHPASIILEAWKYLSKVGSIGRYGVVGLARKKQWALKRPRLNHAPLHLPPPTYAYRLSRVERERPR